MMVCTEKHVANVFEGLSQGMLIKQKSSKCIYRYNEATELWEQSDNLKTVFIHLMDLYMDILDESKPNMPHFIGKRNRPPENLESEKEDTDNYYEKKKTYRLFLHKKRYYYCHLKHI